MKITYWLHYCASYYDLLCSILLSDCTIVHRIVICPIADHLMIALLCVVLWSAICRSLNDRTIVHRIAIWFIADHLTIILLCTVLWSAIFRSLNHRTIVRRIYIRLWLHNICIVVMIYYKVDQITTAHIVRRSYGLLYSSYFIDRTRKYIMIDDSIISRLYNDCTKCIMIDKTTI